MDDAQPTDHAPRARRRLGLIVGFLVILSGAGYWYVYGGREPPSNELILYGNIDIREVDVAFNEAGRVIAMHVEEGDAVEAGHLLAEIDAARLEHPMLQAEAKVAAQRALLARFEHGSRPEEVERARAGVRVAEAELEDTRLTHERLQELLGSDLASRQLTDDANAHFLTAQARLDMAHEELKLAVQGPRSEDTEAVRAQLRADENALELARHRLLDTKLYAPASSIVRTRIVEPGAVVLPNTPVYSLALSDPVWVRVYLSEPDLGHVFPGMQAEITSDSFPTSPRSGWVGFISPTAEFTPKPVESPDLRSSLVYQARIYLHDPDHTLRQGMPVTVRLSLDRGSPSAPRASDVEPMPATPPPTQ